MSAHPRLKKSETLEVRLPYPTKLAFMASCREGGQSASEVLRRFIHDHLAGQTPLRSAANRWRRLILGALIAAAAGAIALPSLAKPGLRSAFDRLDLDGDHAISLSEFARLDADHDGKISFEEFRAGLTAAARR